MRLNSKKDKKSKLRLLLEKDDERILADTEDLKEVLNKLRFEGRQHHKKNITRAFSALTILKQRLFTHMEEEEDELFPFLWKRLPRLEPVRHLFLSEHLEFRNKIKGLFKLLRQFKINGDVVVNGALIHEIYCQGMYLACFVISHIQVENNKLYEAIDNELKADEKQKLLNLLVQF